MTREPLPRGLRRLEAGSGGVLGRGGSRHRLVQARGQGVRRLAGRLRPLVRRGRVQHLLQRRRPACRRRAGRAGGDRLRQPGHRREAHASPMPSSRRRRRRSGPCSQDLGVGKGDRVVLYMPMIPEAVIGMLACARIGADPLGGVRRLRREASSPTRIDDARPKAILVRLLRHRGRAGDRLQAAARRGDRGVASTSPTPA